MNEKLLTEKYILILNKIIEKETLYPNPLNHKMLSQSKIGWEIDSCDFDLHGLFFVCFFQILEGKNILKMSQWTRIPEESKIKGKIFEHNDKGEIIWGTESVVFYNQINIKKAKEYRNELKELQVIHKEKNESEEINVSHKKKMSANLSLPDKIEWDKVTLKIKDGLKDLEIFYNNKLIKLVSYNDLGFSSNKKDFKENRAWELLKILSILSAIDIKSATPNNLALMLTNLTGKKITKENLYQIKKTLSESLKSIFNTEDDPFLDYKSRGFYDIKFKLLPEPDLRNNGIIWSKPSGYNDNIVNILKINEEFEDEA